MQQIRKLALLALTVIMSALVFAVPKAAAIEDIVPRGSVIPCPICKEDAYEELEERPGAPIEDYCEVCKVRHQMPTKNVYKKTVCSVCDYESDLRFHGNYSYCTR